MKKQAKKLGSLICLLYNQTVTQNIKTYFKAHSKAFFARISVRMSYDFDKSNVFIIGDEEKISKIGAKILSDNMNLLTKHEFKIKIK